MAVKARIKNKDFLLNKEINERLPVILNGLVYHYPFDNTVVGISRKSNLLDTSVWKVGTSGSQGNFICNGAASENQIIIKENPWGVPDVIWASLQNDATSDADGGWNVTNIPIDKTKRYRLSVWIRREDVGNGRTYFGCQGNTVCNLSDGAKNSNPYFGYPAISQCPELANNWLLFVAYIHPYDYTGSTDPRTGIYRLDGTKITSYSLTDFKWAPDATVGGHRTYLYYSTTTTEKHFWCRPRFEIDDGNIATIQELLMGIEDVIHPVLDSYTTKTAEGVAIEIATENLLETVGGGASQDWSKWSHWNSASYWPNLCTQYDDPVWGKVFKGIPGSISTYIFDYYPYSYAVGDVLSFSCYMRVDQTVTKTITFYVNSSSGGQHNVAPTCVKTVNFMAGEWQYLTFTSGAVTEAVNGTGGFGLSMGNFNGITVEIAFPHFEKNIFNTSYCKGIRSGNGLLDLPLNLGSDFTIFYRFIPDFLWATYYTSAYNKYMWYLYDKNTGKKIWQSDYHATGTYTYSNPWIGFDEFNTSTEGYPWHWHSVNTIMTGGKEFWFALTKSGSTWTKYFFTDYGYVKSSIEHTKPEVVNFSPSKLELYYDFCWKVKDLSIYDRALSEEEILKLASAKSFSLRSNGDLHTCLLKEKQDYLKRDLPTYIDFTGVIDSYWSKYEQTNIKVYTSKCSNVPGHSYSYFIYRPANLIYPDCGNTTWGGIVVNLPNSVKKPGTWKLRFKYRGHSTPNNMEVYFAYSVGWTSMGVGLYSPAGTSISAFDTDEWQQFEFIYTITAADITQTGTDSNTYDCMRQMKIGFGYQSTDSIGTRVFVNDIEILPVSLDSEENDSNNEEIGIKSDRFYCNEVYEDKILHKIFLLGTAFPDTSGLDVGGNRVVRVDGVDIVNTTGRGLRLDTFDSNMSYISGTTYDVYGDDLARTNLANDLLTLSITDKYWSLTSYDAIGTNTNLTNAMVQLGSKLWSEIVTTNYRHTYCCFGKGSKILYEDGSKTDSVDRHRSTISTII
jgi:hypothetical protein